MTEPLPIQAFSFKDKKSFQIPLTDKIVYPHYKIVVNKFSVEEDSTIEMQWGQNSLTVIPTYVTDVTWEANQGDDGKRVTNHIADGIDLVGMPIESDLPHQVIFDIELERWTDGALAMTWKTAFSNRKGAFYASKGIAASSYRQLNHVSILPSIPTRMSGEVKLFGYTK